MKFCQDIDVNLQEICEQKVILINKNLTSNCKFRVNYQLLNLASFARTGNKQD